MQLKHNFKNFKKLKNKELQKVDLGTVFWYNIQKKRDFFLFSLFSLCQ